MNGGHRLDPLLNPRSVALVGASPRADSVGNWMLETFLAGGYAGELYLVNPNYETIGDHSCYPSLADLPEVPDMALLNVGRARMEALFEEAIGVGVRSLTLFDYCMLEGDTEPKLLDRLKGRARDADIPVCGGGGMGLYNFDARVHASFYNASSIEPGPIALISHSGSVFTVLVHNDRRYRYNLVVSAGHEIGTTVDEFMDYALEMTSTRAIALFIETIRNPSGFIAALKKAHARDVPVIVCKVGRTEESAHFAYTHLGAIAGDDAAYDAVFERYGALRAATLDDLMGTALLMSQKRRAGPGGLASVTDSGGLRELLIDMADEIGVPFATIGPDTLAKLRACLPYTLEASNPLDAGAPFSFDYAGIFRESLHALMDDPDTAVGSFEFDAHDDFNPVPAQAELAMSMPGYSEKPFFVVNSFAGARNMALAQDLLAVGVPVLNGTATALKAVRHAFAYRDHRARPAMVPPAPPDDGVLARWRARLSATTVLAETAGLELLRNFGVPVVTTRNATNRESAIVAAEELGYPVALKTSDPAIQHKTEVRGVRLALPDARAVAAAYVEMVHRLGPRVTVAPMVERGVEMSFGFVNDPQFGALVAVGAGGTLIELLGDQVLALAPFDEIEARRLIDRLAVRPLLDGLRGAPAVDLEALAGALARFSVLPAELSDCLSEADVNPVIAGPEGCLAVDALMVGRGEEIVEVRHG